jgi:predicted Zn-dependent protease
MLTPFRGNPGHRFAWFMLVGACATAVLSASGCTVNPANLQQQFNVISETREISIGRNAHTQIVEYFGYYHNQRLQRYVDRVGQKLATVSKRRDIEYTFTVLDSDMVNAFAVPGGFIYITRGLLAMLNNEAEMAGVLAHEIGHIVGRDSAAMMSQNMLAQAAMLAGAVGLAASGSGGDIAAASMQLYNSLMLGFSREREYLADEQSVDYLFAAGYDPVRVKDFMLSLSRIGQGPSGPQQYMMTHPFIFDRISRIESRAKVVRAMHNTMGQLNSRSPDREIGYVGEDVYLSYIDGLAYGPRDNMRRLKLYTVRRGDTFEQISRRTLGSAHHAKELSLINGMPESAPLIPGAIIKVLH